MNRTILSYLLGKLGVRTAMAAVPLTANVVLDNEDFGKHFVNKTSSNYTITIPSGLRDGFRFSATRISTGNVTIVAGSGVAALVAASDYVKTAAVGTKISVDQYEANKYSVSGAGAVA